MELAIRTAEASTLQETEKNEINKEVDRIIQQHKKNRYEVNRLVFESVAALTESGNYSDELNSQGSLKRFWGGITGKNRKLQQGIDNGLARAQYASQQTLQKLAEQNLMSFELITAVNNKLNASIIEVETEINKIYGTLVTFFKQTKSDIIQLESRVERLEKNVNLLNWQNSIEYQMWNGVEYTELDETSKIMCVIRDFYEITKGKWTTSDLLLLKSAMASIGLNCNEEINVRNILNEICKTHILFENCIPDQLKRIKAEPQNMLMMSYVQKKQELGTTEKYIIDFCEDITALKQEKIVNDLVDKYFAENVGVTFDCNIKLFEFIVEMLYNINMLKEKKNEEECQEKLKKAESLFWKYNFDESADILQEMAEAGNCRARFLLAYIYERGCYSYKSDMSRAKSLFEENISNGDFISIAYTECKPYYNDIFFSNIYENNDWAFDYQTLEENLKELEISYEKGDVLVDYIFSKLSILKIRFSKSYYLYEDDNKLIQPFMDKLREMSENGNNVALLELAEQTFIGGYYDEAYSLFEKLECSNIGRVYYYLGEYCAWGYGDHAKYGQQSDEVKAYRFMGKKAGDRLAELNCAYATDDQEKRNEIIDDDWENVRDLARGLDYIAIYEYGDLARNGNGCSKNTEYAKWLYQLGANAGVWKCRKKLEDM